MDLAIYFVCALLLQTVSSAVLNKDSQYADPAHTLVKRFNRQMFGCRCSRVMECRTDRKCKVTRGKDYHCVYSCCGFRCQKKDVDD